MSKIAPSLLSADFAALGDALSALEAAGAEVVHIDVMDGSFVPPITVGAQMVKALRARTRLTLDVHLMVCRPLDKLDAFLDAGSDVITVHQEAEPHLQRALAKIRREGALAGVALNPATPLCAVENVLDDIDVLLLMTVNPGYGGQEFIPAMRRKLKNAADLIGGNDIKIELDGGVNYENAHELASLGANLLVAGNAIFAGSSIKKSFKQLSDSVSI